MKQTSKITVLIAGNPIAHRNYTIESRFEAGIALLGWEAKSLRQKRMQLKNSHARLIGDEVWLIGANVSPVPNCKSSKELCPSRTRKLLLKKHEIKKLIGAVTRRGYTLVPIKAYWKDNLVKLELGVGKGKHLYDKRADQKLRDRQKNKLRSLKHSKNRSA